MNGRNGTEEKFRTPNAVSKKKKYRIAAAAALIVVLLAVFNQYLIPRPVQREFGIQADQIDRVRVSDGTYGTSYDITDPKEIREFLQMFDGVWVRKHPDQRGYSGWTLAASLYTKGSCVSAFTFGYNLMNGAQGRYYSSKNFDAAQIQAIEEKYRLNHQL